MTMKCPKCGRHYPEDTEYCNKCEARLIRSPPESRTEATAPRESIPTSEISNQEKNGELRQLLELRRKYRAGAAALEAELKEYMLALEKELKKYREETAYRKKRLKEKYLEDLSDFIFAEADDESSSRAPEKTRQ